MKRKIFALTVLSAALLCSCEKMGVIETLSEAPPREIMAKAYSALPTRTPITGTTFPTDRKFKLSAYFNAPSGNTSQEYFNDILFSYDSGNSKWKASTPKYWPLNGTLSFLAVSSGASPFPSVTWGGTGKRKTEQASVTISDNTTAQDDILAAYAATKSYSASGVPLTFSHAESLLAFTVKGTTGVKINSITIEAHSPGGTCTITLSSGSPTYSWSLTGTAAPKTISVSGGQALTGSASTFGSPYLVIPQTGKDITINYTVDGLTLTHTVSAPVNEWASEKKYTYAINLTLDEIMVTASVTDWTAENTDISI